MSPVVICQMSQSDVSRVSILGQEECSRELYVRRINTFQGDEVPMMLLVWWKWLCGKYSSFPELDTVLFLLTVSSLFAAFSENIMFRVHQQLLTFTVYTCGGRDWWPESDATVGRPESRLAILVPTSFSNHTGHVFTLGQDSTSAMLWILLFIILFNLSKMSQVFACLINLIGPRPLSLSPLLPVDPSCLPQMRLEKVSEG